MAEVIALGELLIDFVPTVSGVTLLEAPAFQKAPGGAPANVVVGLARLGVTAGFMGQVGDDAFGHFLANTLRDNQVDVSALRFSGAARTRPGVYLPQSRRGARLHVLSPSQRRYALPGQRRG